MKLECKECKAPVLEEGQPFCLSCGNPFYDFPLINGETEYIGPAQNTDDLRAPKEQIESKLILRITLESGERFDYLITKEQTRIGRMDDNDIVIDNPYVSKYHAVIHRTNHSYIIVDLGSANGIGVNDLRVREHQLRHGEIITLGRDHVYISVHLSTKSSIADSTYTAPIQSTAQLDAIADEETSKNTSMSFEIESENQEALLIKLDVERPDTDSQGISSSILEKTRLLGGVPHDISSSIDHQIEAIDKPSLRNSGDQTLAEYRRPLRVFLCHSSDDKPVVRRLYSRLVSDEIAAWLDEERILPGQDWKKAISKALQASDVIIVCLSQSSVTKSGYLQKEIMSALELAEEQPEDTIFIIPLKLEECWVPERLSRWHWVNLFAEDGYERLRRALQARALIVGSSWKTDT